MYIDFSSQPERVKNLQETMRELGLLTDQDYLLVGVDGKYDSATKKALIEFQKRNGLDVTGDPDNNTWSLLTQELALAREDSGPAIPVSIFHTGCKLCMGECSDLVLIVQIMLREVGLFHDFNEFIPLNGTFDTAMESTIKEFQQHTGLTITGVVNVATWNRLALEFGNIEQ